MSDAPAIPTPAAVEAMLLRGPFHRWLGLRVLAVGEGTIELRATWREEWVVNPDRRATHGGILASLIDLTADWALVSHMGRGVPTIDMRVDYHRPAMPGDLICRGRVVRLGGQFSVAEAGVHDLDGKLCASGRGVYLTAPPAPRAAGGPSAQADPPPPPQPPPAPPRG